MKTRSEPTIPLKRIIASMQSGTSVNGAPWPAAKGRAGVLKTSAVYGGVFEPAENKEVVPEEVGKASCPVRAGDLIVSRMNTRQHLGVAAVVRRDYPHLYLPDRLWSVTFQGTDSRFVDWWTKTDLYRTQVEAVSVGTSSSMQNISQGDFGEIRIHLPRLEIQRLVADYLDRETARIDTLIEEQRRLIDMLRDRRVDLIRASVLGVRNPMTLLAGGGGTVIGYHCSVTLGKMLDAGKPSRNGDMELPYIRAANIQDSGLELSDVKTMPYSSAEAGKFNLLANDLLVVEGGAVGTNVVVTEDMPGWSFQKTVNRVRPLAGWSTPWLGYVLRAYRDLGVFEIICQGSTIPHLTAEKLRHLRVPDSAPDEQRRIAAYLDEQTAKIDDLISETKRFIELSQERRAALITAAVTGQIDVREVA